MSTAAAHDVVAAELVAARREGRGLTGFPGVVPASMAEAYQIQELAMSRWQDSLVGWKIGYISADRRTAGDPDRLVGPIWRQQYHLSEEHVSAVEVGIFASGFAAVEAELVIRLSHDLPSQDEADWTAQEVADLEQHLLVGIEVASSPIPDINSLGPTVIAADFGNNNGLVLGSVLADRPGGAPVQLACYVDGQLMGEGTAENLPGGDSSWSGDCAEYPRQPKPPGPSRPGHPPRPPSPVYIRSGRASIAACKCGADRQ
jgi:2-keto-4-pentenoate hydratase